jgi:hypothetical protein
MAEIDPTVLIAVFSENSLTTPLKDFLSRYVNKIQLQVVYNKSTIAEKKCT